MSQGDIFAALQTGVKFDKKRFGGDLNLFGIGSRPRDAEAGNGMQSEASGSSRRDGRCSSNVVAKVKKRKQDKGLALDNRDENVEGLSVFSLPQRDLDPGEAAGDILPARSKAGATKDPMEEANALRKQHRIRVTGSAIPDPLKGFDTLRDSYKAPKRLLENLAAMGFKEPTAIQRQTTTALLAERELLAVAPTGSGKTLAFLLPIVMAIARRRWQADQAGVGVDGLSGLVVSPTRELAAQTSRCLDRLTTRMRIRGALLTKSTAAGTDFSKVDVLLATPLLLKHLTEDLRLDLSTVRHLVLDEADRLFDLGFLEQVDDIIAACSHPGIVRSLFSATLPEKVEELARNVLRDPIRITVGERNAATSAVDQRLQFVGSEEGRALALQQILTGGVRPPVLVFVGSKERAHALHKKLMYDGFHTDVIHSDQSQAARNAAVDGFRGGKTWVLIATDLMARGMDFLGVNTVINFDFPNSTIDYIHRIGRTGRGGQTGSAVTFFTEDDAWQLRSIANVMRNAGCEVPSWILTLKKVPKRKQHALQRERQQQLLQATESLRDAVLPKYDRKKMDRKSSMVAASKRKRQE